MRGWIFDWFIILMKPNFSRECFQGFKNFSQIFRNLTWYLPQCFDSYTTSAHTMKKIIEKKWFNICSHHFAPKLPSKYFKPTPNVCEKWTKSFSVKSFDQNLGFSLGL